jgi:hypothetical protein
MEVHHIVPKLWAYHQLGWSPEKVNSPFNGLALCRLHHLGFIHPDIGKMAHQMYRWTKESYKMATQWHAVLCEAGIEYWFWMWDHLLLRQARERTKQYLLSCPDDPWPKARYRGARKPKT